MKLIQIAYDTRYENVHWIATNSQSISFDIVITDRTKV